MSNNMGTWGQYYKSFYRGNLPPLMVLLPSSVIKHHYSGKHHRMAVNSLDKKFYNIGPRQQT